MATKYLDSFFHHFLTILNKTLLTCTCQCYTTDIDTKGKSPISFVDLSSLFSGKIDKNECKFLTENYNGIS